MQLDHFSLMKNAILNGCQPLDKILTILLELNFKIEEVPIFICCFLGVEEVPKEINNNNMASALEYINQTISSNFPDESVDKELCSPVRRLQIHHHSTYCNGNTGKCRFGFPRQVAKQTRLVRNTYEHKQNKGRFYVTGKNKQSRFVNDYTTVILRHWRANMDIQYIQDTEGAAYWVCS